MKTGKQTLESEVKIFAESLPYWSKYLADIILKGNAVSKSDIDLAYQYLLEELGIKHPTNKPVITIHCKSQSDSEYGKDTLFTKLEGVEGVNALCENQIIEFSPGLTIIYGGNGSGKSGYVRLLKKAFYSKAPENILPDVNLSSGHKRTSAKFTFLSADAETQLVYPNDNDNSVFKQYAVFDRRCAKFHLDNKNEFEFCPAGLSFFSKFTESIKIVESKLSFEITNKSKGFKMNDLLSLFDGESDIKRLIQNTPHGNINVLKNKITFLDSDKVANEEVEKKYDELLLATRDKDQEIRKLASMKPLLTRVKRDVERVNSYLTNEYSAKIKAIINKYKDADSSVQKEGIENFATNKIQGVGSAEWRNFIIAAEKFAKIQNLTNINEYPKDNNSCLFCQQPLSDDANNLIKKYWSYVKSVAERTMKECQNQLNLIKSDIEKIQFDLFPKDNILSIWLEKNYPKIMISTKRKLREQKAQIDNIISDVNKRVINERAELITSVACFDEIIVQIDKNIGQFSRNEQSNELDKLQRRKTALSHKKKFNTHLPKFEEYAMNNQWVAKAQKISWMGIKRKITDMEKHLRKKYFNEQYIYLFNKECDELKGNFDITINHTGAGGTSYRGLSLKGQTPSVVLSEGEQKVIAIADFLAEMKFSEINKGIIFDDPVTSLDQDRKEDIALRLAKESIDRQVIIFTHDLVFVSHLIAFSEEYNSESLCHWIENRNGNVGQIWLKNAPCYEKNYRNANYVRENFYAKAKKDECPPEKREYLIKSGFSALRTCYEVLVINGLFKNVVQRYNERVSVDSLNSVYFNQEIIDELMDGYHHCCRYMEGHTHSDAYAYLKPDTGSLNGEIDRYEVIRTKINKMKKPKPQSMT